MPSILRRFFGAAAILSLTALHFGLIRAAEIPDNASPLIPNGGERGLWIWKTDTVLGNLARQNELAKSAQIMHVSDIYIHMNPRAYLDQIGDIQQFNANMSRAGIRVWALDGCRCYLSDANGPRVFLAGVRAMIAFNGRSAIQEQFYGFQSDIEPQDSQEAPKSFHNEIPDTKLDTINGGVWQRSAAQDRESLLEDWLETHRQAATLLHARKLKLGAAMPFWTENYYGEPIFVNWQGGRPTVGQAMMDIVDEYVIMSYNTDPDNAVSRVIAQVKYASSLPANHRPKVLAAMETNRTFGEHVSYGDTAGKQSKAVVLADLGIIQDKLQTYPAFAGVAIEDWNGFQLLAK